MKKWCFFCVLMALLAVPARAEAPQTHCFSPEELGTDLQGIWLQQVPRAGSLMLGDRELRPGDVLTAEQTAQMTYCSPLEGPGKFSYVPIGQDGVLPTASFLIPGRKNSPPVAQDSALETYQNMENRGTFRLQDPEEETLKITILRQPRRGRVTLEPGGKFLYTPEKNKVGRDSFTFQAVDPAGNSSREAQVTVTILKPSEDARYHDTAGTPWEFSAQWMRETGIFQGEQAGDLSCFYPEKPVSGGEFLTMLLKTLGIPPEPSLTAGLEGLPSWLQPYGAAAIRWGLPSGLPGDLSWDQPISRAEAAVLTENGLDLPVPAGSEDPAVPSWTAEFCRDAADSDAREPLTRGQAAELLYQVRRKITEP